MDLLESIFSEPKFKIPVEFGSDDFKTEVDTLLTIYIRELEGRVVSQAVLDSCLETPQRTRVSWYYRGTENLRMAT